MDDHYVKCGRCDGKGYIEKYTSEDRKYHVRYFCNKCWGSGCVEWIEAMFGDNQEWEQR